MSRPLIVMLGVLALLIVGAVVGGSVLSGKGVHERANPLGKDITADQYDALKQGDAVGDVIERVHQTGLREDRVQPAYRQLFPAHGADVNCSYWYVKDRDGVVARLCFSNPGGLLKQKLLRTVPRV